MILRMAILGLLGLLVAIQARTVDCRLLPDGSISSVYAPALNRADAHAKLGPMFAVTR